MLHLQTSIHFQEIELAVSVGEELNRSGIRVSDCFGRLDCNFSHPLAHVGVNKRRRRFFQDLLMAALNRALAFSKVNAISVLISENLNFNMPRIRDCLFKVNFVASKSTIGFTLGRCE